MPSDLNRHLDEISKHLRDKRQRGSFAMDVLGPLTEGERKSMEPIAARACGAPEQTNARHERPVHLTASGA